MADFEGVFSELRPLLAAHAPPCKVATDEATSYALWSHKVDRNGRDLWVGGVSIKKRYVSFHLMPVYVFPELLEGMSPELQKRMQGKSCFNFTKVDEAVFEELRGLVDRAIARYQEEGML